MEIKIAAPKPPEPQVTAQKLPTPSVIKEDPLATEKAQKAAIETMSQDEILNYIRAKLPQLKQIAQRVDEKAVGELDSLTELFESELSTDDLGSALELLNGNLLFLDPQNPDVKIAKFAVHTLTKKLASSPQTATTEEPKDQTALFGEKIIEQTNKTVDVSDLPWATEKDQTRIKLRRVKVAGTNLEFFVGDATGVNKVLAAARQKVDPQMLESSDKLLLANAHRLLEEGITRVPVLKNGIGKRPIHELTTSGFRVHFLQLAEPLDGKPVMIHVATYDKKDQGRVFAQLTNESRQYTKIAGKL